MRKLRQRLGKGWRNALVTMQWGRAEDRFLSSDSELYPPANTHTHVHAHTHPEKGFISGKKETGRKRTGGA